MMTRHKEHVMNFIKPVVVHEKTTLERSLHQTLDSKIEETLDISQRLYDLATGHSEEAQLIIDKITRKELSGKSAIQPGQTSEMEQIFIRILQIASNAKETYVKEGEQFASIIRITALNSIVDIKETVKKQLEIKKLNDSNQAEEQTHKRSHDNFFCYHKKP